jgi:hypothetical protein
MNKQKPIDKFNIEKQMKNGLIYRNMENNLYLEQSLNEEHQQSMFEEKKE